MRDAKTERIRESQREPKADIIWRPVRLGSSLPELLARLKPDDEPALLDSSAADTSYGRYSILACRPIEVLTLSQGVLSNRAGRVLASGADEVWAQLAKAMQPIATKVPQCPYSPGWIGYVGYEVGRLIERLPSQAVTDTNLPDLRLAFYDAIVLYDTVENTASLVELKFRQTPPPGAGAGAELLSLILPSKPAASRASVERTAQPPVSNFTPEQYRQAITRCLEYVAAGDIFQANLSQRFEVPQAPPPRTTYRILRHRNPADYSAYIEFTQQGRLCAVLSSSPELFLRVRGQHVTTRPIKGTRARSGDQQADAAARTELLASAKDNAELAMIVDLLRNDLGRICRHGSIAVTEPCELEAYPTVFHLVATVEGELRDEVGPAQLLRATFPGGSITGAPKIRAMEIIDELEGPARGVYSGCLGIVCADGDCEWNIAIRTMVYDDGRALIQAGGGIVADSQPDAEYHETLDKARALIEALAMARDVS